MIRLIEESQFSAVWRRCHVALQAAIVILGVSLCTNLALADEKKTTLQIIDADDGCIKGVDKLRDALEAHLVSHLISVETYRTPELPSTKTGQVELARSVAGKSGVRAVVWADLKIETVYLMLREGSSERIVEREIPGIFDGLEQYCDAVASIVQSTLVGMIEKKKEVPGGWMALQIGDSESPLDFDEPVIEAKPLELGVLISGGYGLHLGSGTRPVNHGAHLSLALLLGEHFGMEVNSDVPRTAYSEFRESGQRQVLIRWPLRILALGFLTAGRWSFGLGLGVDVEMVKVQKESTDVVARGFDDVRPAFAGHLMLRVRLLRWLEVWLKASTDIYGSRFEHAVDVESSYDGESSDSLVVLEYGKAQEVITAGLAFRWSWEISPPQRSPVEGPPAR